MDKERFLEYIKEEFPGVIDDHWNWDLLDNILNHAIDCHSDSEVQLISFLEEMIPQISREEILRFM